VILAMAKKKPESNSPICDALVMWPSIIGALIVLVTLVPALPWRMMDLDQHMGSRFAVQRYVTLFTMSNNMQRGVTWLKLRKDTCRRMQEYAQPNPVGMLGGLVASKLHAGGSVVGCQQWMKCKTHVSTRCTVYTTIAITSLTAMALIAIGAIAAICTCVFKSKESSAGKKKNKQEEARFTTMIVSVVAFLLPTSGVAAWIFVTQSQFKSLQHSAYYPYPGAHAGCFIAPFGCFMLFLAMVGGIIRAQPEGSKKEEEEEYEGNEDVPPMFPMGPDLLGAHSPPDFAGMPPPPPLPPP